MFFTVNLLIKIVTCIHVYAMVFFVHHNFVFFCLILDGKTADALIKEDLRQKLIFKHYPEKFLRYIQLFSERCL